MQHTAVEPQSAEAETDNTLNILTDSISIHPLSIDLVMFATVKRW